MPLSPATLGQTLSNLGDPASPAETAEHWFDAWWVYARGMVYLNPATLEAARSAARAPFVGGLIAACVPSPVPLVFFLALEASMRAAWLVLATPAFLLPPAVLATPNPVPFAPLALATVPVGMASSAVEPPRVMLAGIIDLWTRGNIALSAVPAPLGPFS